MLALNSHHFIERTPTGEEAWRLRAMLPDDRKVLGLLRNGLTVASLMSDLELDPSTLEVVLQRLARRGFIRIDSTAPAPVAQPVIEEPKSPVPVDDDGPDALSSLLARQIPEESEAPTESAAVLEREAPLLDIPLKEPDESAVPIQGTPEDLGLLMSMLSPNAPKAVEVKEEVSVQLPEDPVAPSVRHDEAAVANLFAALVKPGKPGAVPPPPQEIPPSTILPPRPSAGPPEMEGSVSGPKFLRMKDATKPSVSSDGITIALSSLPKKKTRQELEDERKVLADAQREYALKKRQERELATKARQEEMAERRKAERKADEQSSLLGISERLRRAIDQQKG